jgi:iron-sulfur cluster repair protein YtfE (RIC family)
MRATAENVPPHPMHMNETMNTITPETTVGELVRALPARARIFEKLGVDYCCGGKRPLAEVCREKGLDPATVIAMLDALEGTAAASTVNPDGMSLGELCDHIERVHHDYLREELPRLEFMTRKVAAVHGDHEPRLREVRRAFESFNVDNWKRTCISTCTRRTMFSSRKRSPTPNGAAPNPDFSWAKE